MVSNITPTVELFNEDCMAVMVCYPDKYFDLACVDPPYGIWISSNPVRQQHTKKIWIKRYQTRNTFPVRDVYEQTDFLETKNVEYARF